MKRIITILFTGLLCATLSACNISVTPADSDATSSSDITTSVTSSGAAASLEPTAESSTSSAPQSDATSSEDSTIEPTPAQPAAATSTPSESSQSTITQDGMILYTCPESDVGYTVIYPETWVIDPNNLPVLTLRPDENESSSYFVLQAALYIPDSDNQNYNIHERKNAENEAKSQWEKDTELNKTTVVEVSELAQTKIAGYDTWYYTESGGPKTIEYYFIDAQTVSGHYKLQVGYAPETDDAELETIHKILESLILLT